MSNLNSLYLTHGNDSIDKLLYSCESLDCLSEKFKTKIITLSLWILSDSKGKEKEISDEIIKLNELMKTLSIFSDSFILRVTLDLQAGLKFETNRTADENK